VASDSGREWALAVNGEVIRDYFVKGIQTMRDVAKVRSEMSNSYCMSYVNGVLCHNRISTKEYMCVQCKERANRRESLQNDGDSAGGVLSQEAAK
jgi:hypothetical protein